MNQWIEHLNALLQVVWISIALVGMLYSKFRLKKNEWAIAFLVALFFLMIGMLDYFTYELTDVGRGL